ncbi:MAG: hypothetical protein RL095_2387 [Verrucomicrobiota bacterium]|jgi:phosphoribosylformimino-5-aminoimidazole carboxamide ribotide isomerase
MFRPCIDLHDGRVKQIVGGSLTDSGARTNFVSELPPAYYAELYRRDGVTGAHVIKLGAGNDAAAREALAAWPGGLQIGGGISAANAKEWLDAGASHLIVTSAVFKDGRFDQAALDELLRLVGRDKLILDLSARIRDGKYWIVTDRWQKFTTMELNPATLAQLATQCDEFLVHAVDVEGLCQGIDLELVKMLAEHSPIPSTYAGGAKSLDDLETVTSLSRNRVHLTIGSALDIFGGTGVVYQEAVAFNRRHSQSKD